MSAVFAYAFGLTLDLCGVGLRLVESVDRNLLVLRIVFDAASPARVPRGSIGGSSARFGHRWLAAADKTEGHASASW